MPQPDLLSGLSDGAQPGAADDTSSGMPDGARLELPAAAKPGSAPTVEVRRSAKRRKTISAFQEGDKLVIAIPASMTKAQEREWVAKMTARMAVRQTKRRPSDDTLYQRALALSQQYLGGRAQPTSVRWTANQAHRWGSCSVHDRAIRISDRARGMPEYVLDYLLLHELTHLLHAGHGAGFWALLADYPQLERARGFLDGAAFEHHRQKTAE